LTSGFGAYVWRLGENYHAREWFTANRLLMFAPSPRGNQQKHELLRVLPSAEEGNRHLLFDANDAGGSRRVAIEGPGGQAAGPI